MYNTSIGKDVNIDDGWFMYNTSIGKGVLSMMRGLCVMIIGKCDCCG